MFITPYFGGCKYTNNFLFINKNIVFQHFELLITSLHALPESSYRPRISSGEISTAEMPCPVCHRASTHRPTCFSRNLCRTVSKTTEKRPKTGPSIMFFAFLMSDGLEPACSSQEISGHPGNNDRPGPLLSSRPKEASGEIYLP